MERERSPRISATKVEARTTSRVVTPKRLIYIRMRGIFRDDLTIPFRVKHTEFLEDLSEDGDGRVYRVGDDQDEGLGGRGGDSRGKIFDNSGVDLTHVF